MIVNLNGRKVLEVDQVFENELDAVCKVLPLLSGPVDQVSIGQGARLVFRGNSAKLLSQLSRAVSHSSLSLNLQCRECGFHSGNFATHFKQELQRDVFHAYFSLLEESHVELNHAKCSKTWRQELNRVKKLFDSCELIRIAKRSNASAALETLEKFTKPGFFASFIDLNVPKGAKLLESYDVGASRVDVYSVPGMSERYYLLTPPEVKLDLKTAELVSSTIEDITQREVKVIDPLSARKHFKEIALKSLDSELSDMVVRHSAGYGLLELFLSDEKIQDVYIDSPGDSPLYLYHADFEECVSNVGLTAVDLEKLGSRLRALSGRPFDESSPVINTELTDLGTRVCGLCPPATFAGYGFAFRRHRPMPWTLPQFIAARMIDSKTAGLLSFLVDGQRSLLITGARASGKSSLLAALIAEISPIYRMVVIEDTPELPIDVLRSYGHKVQHIRIKAALGEDSGGLELSAEDALRTALRLGESVLILGEVRGPEAKSLFEAMRVGAAGNVVMGTVHGSSAYDTWDRIVNDLNVPTTSFKATDAVVSLASVRSGDETKRMRRLVSVTEVKKHWRQDPFHENGFNNLVEYNSFEDSWKHNGFNSEIINDVARLKKFSKSEVEKNIHCKASVKDLLVKKAKQFSLPALLELKATIDSNQQYAGIVSRQIEEHGKVNYRELLSSYSSWLQGYCKELK